MKKRENFNSPKVPRTTNVFPQAVIAGEFIFLSGTTGVDPVTGKLSTDFEEQATQAFRNVRTILTEAGSSLEKIIKTTIFMVTGNEFSVLNKVYASFFPDNAPARSAPQVMPFPSGILISVECIAQIPVK